MRQSASRTDRARYVTPIAAAFFSGLMLLAGLVMVVERGKGTLTIECEGENVPVTITRGEEVVKSLTLNRTGASVRIAAGEYSVMIDGELEGFTINDGAVKLQRGGHDVVRIVRRDTSGEVKQEQQAATALESFLANARDLHSYTATYTARLASNAHGLRQDVQKVYWVAPSHVRFDQRLQTIIHSGLRQGIRINHEYRTYSVVPPLRGVSLPLERIDRLAEVVSAAVCTPLAPDQSDGGLLGFELDLKSVDPDFVNGNARFWLDKGSNLPTTIEYAFELDGERQIARYDEIKWNLELDPRLFDASEPRDYAQVSDGLPDTMQQIQDIAHALKTYAEYCGRYPKVSILHSEVLLDDMIKKAAVKPGEARPADIDGATPGLNWLSRIQKYDSEFAYYGATVRPGSEQDPLVHWVDGDYRIVVFGDLRSTVSDVDSIERNVDDLVETPRGHAAQLDDVDDSLLYVPYSFERVKACHWRYTHFQRSSTSDAHSIAESDWTEEGWMHHKYGWIVERREGSQLKRVTIQTPRGSATWDIAQNHVVASRGRCKNLPDSMRGIVIIRSKRETVEHYKPLRPVVTSTIEAAKGVEKVQFQFLADPDVSFDSPIHDDWLPKLESLMSTKGAERRSRTYWFDVGSELIRKRQCGCRIPKYEFNVDYPSPESLRKDRFFIRVRNDTTHNITDPELLSLLHESPND